MRTDIGPVESQVACWCGSGLQELANAKGNILENKELLDSLNQTKQNSITIVQSLDESVKLQTSLDAVSFLHVTLISLNAFSCLPTALEGKIMRLVVSICLSIRPYISIPSFEPTDL